MSSSSTPNIGNAFPARYGKALEFAKQEILRWQELLLYDVEISGKS
jgi:hypothetical protein